VPVSGILASSPAEIAHGLGPVGEGLPGPKAGHTGQRRGVHWGPVYRAGLLLHHPPAAAAHGAVEVMVEGLKIGVALLGIGAFVGVIVLKTVFQKAQRVAVP